MVDSSGIQIALFSAMSGRMRVKGPDGKQTDQSRMMDAGAWTSWTLAELQGYGFNVGDSCWVSVDIAGGETNHESGDNFNLVDGGVMHTYELRGGIWNPSWSLN